MSYSMYVDGFHQAWLSNSSSSSTVGNGTKPRVISRDGSKTRSVLHYTCYCTDRQIQCYYESWLGSLNFSASFPQQSSLLFRPVELYQDLFFTGIFKLQSCSSFDKTPDYCSYIKLSYRKFFLMTLNASIFIADPYVWFSKRNHPLCQVWPCTFIYISHSPLDATLLWAEHRLFETVLLVIADKSSIDFCQHLLLLYHFQLAVQNGCGGPHAKEKAEWMVGAVFDWFMENGNFFCHHKQFSQ